MTRTHRSTGPARKAAQRRLCPTLDGTFIHNPQETTLKKTIVTLATALVASGVFAQDAGIVSRPSKFSVAKTADRLKSAIKTSGVYRLFLRLDHAANAKEVDATLRPSQLILFGNPKGWSAVVGSGSNLGPRPSKPRLGLERRFRKGVAYL